MVGGFVIIAIMCRRPPHRGLLKTTLETTRSKNSAQAKRLRATG